ncbi:MAG: HAD family hydrolase [Candidatus Omnitrophica bacterium]|nr:HAD family hydrolase [Candidatus Omnitrophota bacterium]
MIKAVIFDLDGTLVNAYSAVSQSVNYTLNALGFFPRSHDEIKRSVGGGDRKLMVHFVGEKLADRAMKIYRPHHTKALGLEGAVKLLPGAWRILKFLKGRGYKLAIASNRPTKFTRIILKVLGILEFFDVVLCADRADRPKPYPDMLWAIAKRLNFNKSEVLYVGDMTIDVKCAHKAGVRMVAVATGSSFKKELKELKPWHIISRIDQLKKIISSSAREGTTGRGNE